MLRTRSIAFLVLASAALLAAGCGSNNKGKIVGKWKATAVSGAGAEGMDLGAAAGDGGMFMEFTEDGRFKMYLSAMGQQMELGSGKYSLGMGDTVTLSDLSPPQDGKTTSRESITIKGDTMTLKGEAGKSITLTRVGAAPAGGGK